MRTISLHGSYLLEDDVNVTSNELGYLLSLCGLHRVVAILVVPKVLKAEQILRSKGHIFVCESSY